MVLGLSPATKPLSDCCLRRHRLMSEKPQNILCGDDDAGKSTPRVDGILVTSPILV